MMSNPHVLFMRVVISEETICLLRQRESEAMLSKRLAAQEIEEILKSFEFFSQGKRGGWFVPGDQLSNRLDAKHLLPWSVSVLQKTWEDAGATSELIGNLFEPIYNEVSIVADKRYKFLKVTYDGSAETGETALGKEVFL